MWGGRQVERLQPFVLQPGDVFGCLLVTLGEVAAAEIEGQGEAAQQPHNVVGRRIICRILPCPSAAAVRGSPRAVGARCPAGRRGHRCAGGW